MGLQYSPATITLVRFYRLRGIRYDGCTGQIADVTCCFHFVDCEQSLAFCSTDYRKKERLLVVYSFCGNFTRFSWKSYHSIMRCFPLFRFFYWESVSSEPACVHTPPLISQIFLICAKFFHTRLSTVNHRHPFSDFYRGEGRK